VEKSASHKWVDSTDTKSATQQKHFQRRMSLQYCRSSDISTNFCFAHASYRKQQEAFETAQRSAATIMTSTFALCFIPPFFLMFWQYS